MGVRTPGSTKIFLQPHDDLALDYISRMLMEDIVDKFFYHYPDLVEILYVTTTASAFSTTSSDALAPDLAAWPGNSTELQSSAPAYSSDMLASALLSGQGNSTGSQDPAAFFFNGTATPRVITPRVITLRHTDYYSFAQ